MLGGILVLLLAANGALFAQSTKDVSTPSAIDDDDDPQTKPDVKPDQPPQKTDVTPGSKTTPDSIEPTLAAPPPLPEPVPAAAPLKREMHEALQKQDTAAFGELLHQGMREFPNDPELKAAAAKWAVVSHDRTVIPAIERLLSQNSNLFGKQWIPGRAGESEYVQIHDKIAVGSKLFGAGAKALSSAYGDLDNGEAARAETTLTKALKGNGSSAPLYYARAMARAMNGDLAQADEDSMRAVKLSRGAPQVLSQRAQLMMQMGRHSEAIAWASKAIEGNPQDADALAVRGRALWKSGGHMAQGLQDLGQAADVDPANYENLYHGAAMIVRSNHAMASLNKGDVKTAKAEAQSVLNEDASNATAHYIFAYTSRKEGNPERAIKEATLALKNRPDLSYALIERGIALEMLGARANALADFKRAAMLNPRQFQGYYDRLLTAQRQGQAPIWQRQAGVQVAGAQ